VVTASHIDSRPIFLQTNYQKETINKNDIKYFHSIIQLKLHSLKGNLEQVLHKVIKTMQFYQRNRAPNKKDGKSMNNPSAKQVSKQITCTSTPLYLLTHTNNFNCLLYISVQKEKLNCIFGFMVTS
jgi:hypothetical protein